MLSPDLALLTISLCVSVQAVGNLTAALKETGMWNNPLFVWTNDNGCVLQLFRSLFRHMEDYPAYTALCVLELSRSPVFVGGSNYPLRGGKGSNCKLLTRLLPLHMLC